MKRRERRSYFFGWNLVPIILGTALILGVIRAPFQPHDVLWGQLLPQAPDPVPVQMFRCRIVRSIPHDPQAFTQGLIFHDGYLFESTGLYGRSTLRKMDPQSGKIVALQPLGPSLFGEGLALFRDTLIQITWREGVALLYDVRNLERKGSFVYPGEGWGLASDGKSLFLSDGSAMIRVLNPSNYREVRRLPVMNGKKPVSMLNELEFMEDEILANVFPTPMIARISPIDGKVKGWIDCSDLCLLADGCSGEKVCNGIAYDREGERVFVTGKLWPRIFEVSFDPVPTAGR